MYERAPFIPLPSQRRSVNLYTVRYPNHLLQWQAHRVSIELTFTDGRDTYLLSPQQDL